MKRSDCGWKRSQEHVGKSREGREKGIEQGVAVLEKRRGRLKGSRISHNVSHGFLWQL